MATTTPTAASSSAPTHSEPEGGSRSRGAIIVAVLVLAAVVTLIFWLHYRYRESTDDAQIAGHIEPIAPRIAGVVTEVLVNDNQPVLAGQVLFRLDDHDYREALDNAQAELRAAEAGASGATSGVPIVEASSGSNLSQAQAALQEAQAGETLAQRQFDTATAQAHAATAQAAAAQATAADATSAEKRFADLVAKDEISKLQWDQVQAQAQSATAVAAAAQAQAAAAQQQVAAANAGIEVARARVAQAAAAVRAAATAPEQLSVSRRQAQAAEARVAQAQAAVAEAELNVGYTVVRAPTAGLTGNKDVEVGQAFAPGQTAMDIVPVNDVWVVANYKETQLRQMHPGQRVAIQVDAFDQKLNATIDSLGTATGSAFSLLPPENATGNYVKVVQRVPVKVVFDAKQDLSKLRPGMSVEATVFTR